MYYAWNWWGWLLWIIPLTLVIWALFDWNGRRYASHRYRGSRDRDFDWDEPWARPRPERHPENRGRGPRNYQRPDSRIGEDINDRLTLSADIDATDVTVDVLGGHVVLSGSVDNRFEKRTAETICDSVAGVKDVDNKLKLGKHDVGSGQTDQLPLPHSQT